MQQLEANVWASSRSQQLHSELLELRRYQPHERRSRLRSLQLELHPDKQPAERREQAQLLFLQVQKEWEKTEVAQHALPKSSVETEAEKQIRLQQEAMATVRKRQSELQRRLEENRRRAEAEERAKCRADTAEQQCNVEMEVQRMCADGRAAEAERRDGRPAIEILSGHCRTIASLLSTRSLSNVLQAFDMIEASRKDTDMDKAEKASLDWFEGECWRRYAAHQAESGQLHDAIDRCLEEAIKLSPRRGVLYLDRARCLSQLACPHLRSEGRLQSEAEVHGARCVLADVHEALARDDSLADAYDLAVQVLIALGDLAAAEKLAKRGEAAVADPWRAKHLQEERRYARNLSRGFAEIEALLIDDQKQIGKAKWLAESLRAMARPSLAPQLQARIEGIEVVCQHAEVQMNSRVQHH